MEAIRLQSQELKRLNEAASVSQSLENPLGFSKTPKNAINDRKFNGTINAD